MGWAAAPRTGLKPADTIISCENALEHPPIVHQPAPRLYLIALPPPIDGFDNFPGEFEENGGRT